MYQTSTPSRAKYGRRGKPRRGLFFMRRCAPPAALAAPPPRWSGGAALRRAPPPALPASGQKRNARQCRPLSSSARRPASLRPATASSSGLRLLRRLPVGSVACAPPIGAAARPSLGGSSGLASPRFAPACRRWRLGSSGRSPCGGLPLRPAAGCVPRPCGAAGSALHPLRGSGCVPRSAFLSSPRLRRLRFACPPSSVAAACAA